MQKTLKSARIELPFTVFLGLIALSVWLLLRLALWVDVGPAQLSLGQTIKMLSRGLWFDLSTLAYLIVPWLLLSIVLPNRWRTKRWLNLFKWVIAWFVTFCLLFGVISEVIFWQEFTTRFNFIAVDYLIYTHEVVGNIRESYPVPLIVLTIAVLAVGMMLLAHKFIAFKHNPMQAKQKTITLLALLGLPLLSYQFANADQMAFSKNAYANELSGNGLFTLASAMRRNELDYDQFYKTIPQAKADKVLRGLEVERKLTTNVLKEDVDEAETFEMGNFKRRPKNVVLVSVESFSASYVGAYGNTENLTPNMDKLAKEGLMFDKIFATGTRTVRGLDALTIAIPPIPGQAIVRRPNNEHLATIGEMLGAQGFNTFFIYGGYGYFDNMNAYYRGNNYKVVDRTDFDKKTIRHENVWGVDDESLFDNAILQLDTTSKTGKPFFAQIMTTSNHRPFTYPTGRIDLPQGNRAGAVKYTDYAIGQLIAKAKTKPWFKDTIFVIVADHCSSVAGKTKLPVAKYHIPLIFYAPDMLPAGHYSRMASQIDIVPTLLDVLGKKGDEHFFGQSLFEDQSEQIASRAFISNYQELGYYKNDTLVVLSPKQKIEAYKVDPITMESTPTIMDKLLLNEAIAYYQTANYAFKTGALKISKNLNP
jgi:phosphoglycerol transferase MdoB-like AlkP superfamily enzyme